MNREELRLMAAKGDRGELTENEDAFLLNEIMEICVANKESFDQSQVAITRMEEVYDRVLPILLERAERAEADAGYLLDMLQGYLSNEELNNVMEELLKEKKMTQ